MSCKNTDNYGRTIDYLRISVTDRCNLRCQYCMPEEGICHKLNHKDILRIEEIIAFVQVAAKEGIRKVRITGGEPLVRKGIVDLIRAIKAIDGIEEIGMTTNGVLLQRFAKDLKEAGLDRVNISLDTLDEVQYEKMTRGGNLSQVMDGIKAASSVGLSPIKLNTVLIGGFNDEELNRFMVLAKTFDLQWRIIELMPIGQVSEWSADHFISGADLLNNHSSLKRVEDTSGGRVKQFYHKEMDLTIGLIDAISGKFCSSCNRLRLTSDGKIKPCLHSDIEYDIKSYIDDEDGLREFYKQCLLNKPKEHEILEEGYVPITRNMNKIGG